MLVMDAGSYKESPLQALSSAGRTLAELNETALDITISEAHMTRFATYSGY